MNCGRVFTLVIAGLLLACTTTDAQRLDIQGVRKYSKASDCATIVFKSDFDSLTITGMSPDSIFREVDSEGNYVWTQYVDLMYEREHGDTMINRRFVLHTPFTEDREIIVPGAGMELKQAIYEYDVRLFDYYPMRFGFEADLLRLRDYFGVRLSFGKRLGGYIALKLGTSKDGFNADDSSEKVDESEYTFTSRIRNSYMAGIKYGVASKRYPIFIYLGAGYGENGTLRSNGKPEFFGRKNYYHSYTNGFESEVGVNVILGVFSFSAGADVLFGHRVVGNINCTMGMTVDPTK